MMKFDSIANLFDGFAKSPISLLRCIPRDLRAAILTFFLCRPGIDFLRVHQNSSTQRDHAAAAELIPVYEIVGLRMFGGFDCCPRELFR